jgi:hypothetical protein
MTTAQAELSSNPLTQFQWKPEPAAEAWVREAVAFALQSLPEARQYSERLYHQAGTRFADIVRTFVIERDSQPLYGFKAAGWEEESPDFFVNRAGVFPSVSLTDGGGIEVVTKVDSVADFLAANELEREIGGEPGAPYRWAVVANRVGDAQWTVAEKHAGRLPAYQDGPDVRAVLAMAEKFRIRNRWLGSDEHGFAHATRLIDEGIAAVGRDYACDLFFAAEREFWTRRNRAAQVQYARQQRLGLGWANHDHHTYRCSREHFARLVAVWEKLGFVCRERFYAGAEAGWGAQVMEHPVTGIVTFNDVDLSPDELLADFAHEPLEPRKELGTVGLWCALHGESFLEAGMHHLECMFDFDALKRQLESDHAIKVMKPFSDFPHLRQAFTEGERWAVRPERIDRLLKSGRITPEQAEKFRTEGAIGSHLENLERNAGFKGFNQKGVSEIISATDPRKQV